MCGTFLRRLLFLLLLTTPSLTTPSGSRKYAYTWRVRDATWEKSSSFCQARNMELVKTDSREKLLEAREFLTGRPVRVSTHFWTGLRAENVSDVTTYSWSDGSAFDLASWSDLPWNTTSLSRTAAAAEPVCFQVNTRTEMKATICSKDLSNVLCELKDGFEKVEQTGTGSLPAWNTFLLQPADPAAALGSTRVVGRWVRGWEGGLVRTFWKWNPGLASVPEDCLLFCLSHVTSRAVQTEYADGFVATCTCLG